ncbi:MAG: CARDB domain-containing protein, partial [Candidatus Thermoplasmatota archaeon]
ILWYYNIEPGGVHNLSIVIENVIPSDSDLSNNIVRFQVAVLGKILIVDDDAYPNDGSINDTVGFMETALYSGGFEYTLYQVPSATADGPQYDLGAIKLKDYDVVIWMCGRTTSSTLTGGPDSGDQQNLTKYLRNGGRLWLIGEGIIDELGTINAFVNQKLRVDLPGTTTDAAPQGTIYGNSSNPISSGMVLETITLPGGNKGDYIGIDPDALKMFNDSFGNCSLSFEGNVDANAVKPTKLVFFTFEFSSIKNADDRAWLAYKIILWFGNITAKIGRDVAVTDITFQPLRVTFRQPVNITATIRNNGIYEEPRVGVIFYIDDIPIAPAQYVSINGTNSSTVSEIWIAQPAGWHVVRVLADPYYEIDETDERNNELRSRVISNQLYVQYSILIVDDDNSTNNGGDGFNTTNYLTSAFYNLSYNYTFWTVSSLATGPNLENLSKYNLVIWCCGNESVNTLTSSDRTNILNYLNQGGKLWLIGQNILDELTIADSAFVKNVLKVNSTELNTGTPRNIWGLKKDPVTHGIYYATTPVFKDMGDRIVPTEEGKPIIFNASNTSACYGLRYENETCQLLFLPFEFGFICGKGVEIGKEYVVSTLWEDNFDSTIKWTLSNLGSGYGWEIGAPTAGIGPGSAYSAPNCSATKLANNYQNSENAWLISPEITLPSDVVFIKLSFWHWYEIEKDYDFGKVKIKVAGSTTWDTLATYTGYYQRWHESKIDITAYRGKKVNISFHFTSDISKVY